MKNQYSLLILFLFPLMIHAANVWTINTHDSRPLLVINEKFKLVSKNIHDVNKDYTLDIRYPKIEGEHLSVSANNFNQLIQHKIDKQVSTFKKEMASALLNKDIPHVPSYLKINYELSSFASRSQNTEWVSMRFSTDMFERGMAHPASQIDVINYDLAQNRELILANLFMAESNYLKIISDYCLNELAKKKIPQMIFSSHYQHWNMTSYGLLMTFDETEIGPRYAGMQEIIVPYNVLKNDLTHEAACTLGVVNCDGT